MKLPSENQKNRAMNRSRCSDRNQPPFDGEVQRTAMDHRSHTSPARLEQEYEKITSGSADSWPETPKGIVPEGDPR